MQSSNNTDIYRPLKKLLLRRSLHTGTAAEQPSKIGNDALAKLHYRRYGSIGITDRHTDEQADGQTSTPSETELFSIPSLEAILGFTVGVGRSVVDPSRELGRRSTTDEKGLPDRRGGIHTMSLIAFGVALEGHCSAQKSPHPRPSERMTKFPNLCTFLGQFSPRLLSPSLARLLRRC